MVKMFVIPWEGAMKTIEWLLQADPYVQYATRVYLLGEDKTGLSDLRQHVLSDGRVRGYLKDMADFYGTMVTTHQNPELPVHKLIFLLDMGLDMDVPEIAAAICSILSSRDERGVFRVLTNVPQRYGGTAEDTLAWALCDAPLMVSALLRCGIEFDQCEPGIAYISSLHRPSGFPCAVSPELGHFRGPGRKDDCCPYATLAMLRLYSLIKDRVDTGIVDACLDSMLDLWASSREKHPYMFFMGTDFRKLKAPTHWYDVVSVAECLSGYPQIHTDPRFQEMLDIIQNKGDPQGRMTPESVYQKCKAWDFGQKKDPSPWLTYVCLRVLKRTNRWQLDT